jgi:hypothetical protein
LISPTCALDNILARYDCGLFSLADSDPTANQQRHISPTLLIFCMLHLEMRKGLKGRRYCITKAGSKDPQGRPRAGARACEVGVGGSDEQF